MELIEVPQKVTGANEALAGLSRDIAEALRALPRPAQEKPIGSLP